MIEEEGCKIFLMEKDRMLEVATKTGRAIGTIALFERKYCEDNGGDWKILGGEG